MNNLKTRLREQNERLLTVTQEKAQVINVGFNYTPCYLTEAF